MHRIVLIVMAMVIFHGTSEAGSVDKPELVREFKGHSGFVCSVAMTPNGKQIVSGAADGKIKFWDVDSGKCSRTSDGHSEWVQSVEISPDGKFVVSAGRDKLVKLWDIESGELLKKFAGHSGIVKSATFSPDGKQLASCGRDTVVKIWDIESETFVKDLGTHNFSTSSAVKFSTGSTQVLLAGLSLQMWDIETGKCLRQFVGHSDSAGGIAISHDGKAIASAGSYTDHSMRYWEADSGECLWTKEFGENAGVWSLEFALKDQILISGHFDGTIKYWDTKSGDCLTSITAHKEAITSISVDSTQKYFVSGSWDKTIKLWKMSTSNPGQ